MQFRHGRDRRLGCRIIIHFDTDSLHTTIFYERKKDDCPNVSQLSYRRPPLISNNCDDKIVIFRTLCYILIY